MRSTEFGRKMDRERRDTRLEVSVKELHEAQFDAVLEVVSDNIHNLYRGFKDSYVEDSYKKSMARYLIGIIKKEFGV